jgi:orotidine-5'-phosphate decarboxylase
MGWMTKPQKARDRLIVALDFPSFDPALDLVQRLRGHAGMFKIGKELFTREGPRSVQRVTALGEEVFLDLKYHDIPNTVGRAVEAAVALGASLINVHACGGRKMMRAATEAAAGKASVIAVTVLTSLSDGDIKEAGFGDKVDDLVVRLARLALDSGVDGVVAAPTDVARLRQELGDNFLIVTPGVRPSGSSKDDQTRIATPAEAIRQGADYIVVGRPITQAEDPLEAADRIVAEMSEKHPSEA